MGSQQAAVEQIKANEESASKASAFGRFHFLIALVVAVAAFAAYLTTLSSGVLPGNPASTLFNMAGDEANLIVRHVVWRKLIGLAVHAGGANLVLVVNTLCATISALAVGFMYLVAATLIDLMLDGEHWRSIHGEQARRDSAAMSVTAGVFAAVTLAFCPPYWVAATQPYIDSFYLLWLLASIFLALRFVATRKIGLLWGFCILYGAGMAQTSCFVAFAPLLYLFILFNLWSTNRLTGRVLGRIVLLTLLSGMLLLVNAWEFHGTEGYELLRINGYFGVVKRLGREILSGIFGSLPRAGWMILLGMTVAPCLAILMTGRRALNGERDWSFYVLHLVVLGVTLAVILDTRVSPWQLYRKDSLQIVPYAMTALTFGYLMAYLHAQTLILFPRETNGAPNRLPQAIRYGAVLLAAALGVSTIVTSRQDADHKRMRFVWMYADYLLNNLEGRTWLLTNGVFDDMVKIRARELGIPVNMLNLSQANNRIAQTRVKNKLKSIRLRNTADIGLFPLVQEWITGEKDVASQLGLCLHPDLWNFGDYEVYPNGLAFFGADPVQMKEIAQRDLVAPYLDMMEAFEPALKRIDDKDSYRNRFYQQLVKGQVSIVGNNLGFLLETFDRKEDAFTIYSRVHDFDPDNISALLNFATMIQGGMHPELKDKAWADLEAFQQKLKAPLDVWALSRTFGYVSSPEAFAKLGWSWAMSGQKNLALKSLTRALKDLKPENRGKLRTVMADVYMHSNDHEASERLYHEILAEDPGDHHALIGLVRISVMNGDTEKAQKYLAQAKTAGVPRQRLLYETAGLELVAGEIDRARIIAQELIEIDPNNAEAHIVMSVIASQLYLDAKTTEAAEAALESLRKSAADLERVAGKDDFRTLFVKGRMHLTTRNYTEARECFKAALKCAPNPNIVPLLDRILATDHALVDKDAALKTAREILHRAPRHGFANYILGSLALEREEHASAEDYLEIALEAAPDSILVLNDLAVAKLKLNKLDEAETIIRRSFKTDNQIYAAWDTLGEILLAKGQVDAAGEAFDTALKLNDKDLRVHLHVAQVHFLRGDLPKSREIIRKLAAGADVFIGTDRAQYEKLSQDLLGSHGK
ncbi:MAG: tetratricopeptide repeat protein [Kiritimatiellia bacterium]|jgi:tetratricopeptide (TPR) repeat protein